MSTVITFYSLDEDEELAQVFSEVIPVVGSHVHYYVDYAGMEADSEPSDVIGIEGQVSKVVYNYRDMRDRVPVYVQVCLIELKVERAA